MKERPIIFSAPMVRVILEGQKTQTRRVIKFKGALTPGFLEDSKSKYASNVQVYAEHIAYTWMGGIAGCPEGCPFGGSGDRLWVREAAYISPPSWINDNSYDWAKDEKGRSRALSYAATISSYGLEAVRDYKVKKTSPIFMPRWASRLVLEIVSVHVEKLQEISEKDAQAEGISEAETKEIPIGNIREYINNPFRYTFAARWDSIHKASLWDSNPWVWVITFKRL